MFMERIVRYGIEAQFNGACSLCGAATLAGERIFKLPAKRGGGKWVCAPCRWDDDDRVIDLGFVVRKVERRMKVGPYTPKLVEVEVILRAVQDVELETYDEALLLDHFEECLELRRSPTLSRAKMAMLLGVLRRVGE
ncbi:hypothetical protein GCM10011492_15710 [Flexivirga endophytica]|uniref:Uncharacterized protein n=2 Tax=Flexivirga endophytica TaxID=1849103 RepID=A0A916T2V9_9MICO|nr:hypothetical protein GCM10011492_15710 [Flexivirga endophytica]GHB54866.1 hypothetical protein GCM10008112_25030 [Flexivirga endophytica]